MDYVITSNGELYHWSLGKAKPRDDHKYIKREQKNGKWVYTYPKDTKAPAKLSPPSSSSLAFNRVSNKIQIDKQFVTKPVESLLDSNKTAIFNKDQYRPVGQNYTVKTADAVTKTEPVFGQNYTVSTPSSTDTSSKPVGQNYSTSSSVGSPKYRDVEPGSVDYYLSKAERYIEAANTWLDNTLNAPIKALTGRSSEYMSWDTVKELIDSAHEYEDPDLFLTDEYRNRRG